MNYKFDYILMTVLICVLSYTILPAQKMKASAEKNQPAIISEFIGQTQFLESRLTDLLGAIPQDKLSWRPMEGVRSFAEVFEHITSANNGFGKMAGLESSGQSKMESEQEKSEMNMPDKQQIMADLKESFTNLRKSISSLSQGELNGQIKAFGMETSRRNFVVSTLNHDHEHLGQLIAYSRMNGIVPPWSK
jgi:uncharacterized damage-inducible protein DinB